MRRCSGVIGAALVWGIMTLGGAAAEPAVQLATIGETPRGAIVETARYRAAISNGVLASFFNKLTAEEYLSQESRLEALLPHLPSGLGTQHTDVERDAARQLFLYPWWEQPTTNSWPNQHYADGASGLKVEGGGIKAVLTYTGLTDGARRFPDETYALTVEVEPGTGDLLVTPAVAAPRGGVYGCGFTLSALAPEVTVEAPIFEGVRLDRHMLPMLWVNRWASFWDYAFLALNGEKTGAVGLWCQDKDLRYYKTLFYLINEQGLSLSVQAMNIPPFNDLKDAKPMTWRLQAFDKSWAQAAARYREWRLKNVKIAPRPDWVKKLSFMEFGGNEAGPGNMTGAEWFFETNHLDRVIQWAPAVRGAGFDKNHANNTPYAGFRADMKFWNAKNRKLMPYLQPMIMWDPQPTNDRERVAVALSREANTRSAFRERNDIVDLGHDQHNLGHPGWQRWFLDWVKEYIQDYGADGIYNDQSYACPIDVRGAAAPGGMTTPQGMADFFYKEATENPNAIQGTEHMMEANNVGASLGLGCGILWGTPGYEAIKRIGPPGSMGWQRIKKASPVSNSLHYPNGAIFAFPHMSGYPVRGAVRFHHGMDQMERRGDLPANECGAYYYVANMMPFRYWENECWLDRQRALLFVQYGLRPVFPENWDRQVLSYFKGDNGEDFRYEEWPWGTAFVQFKGGQRILHYARVQEVRQAAVGGAIHGWPCYDDQGPSGLNTAVTYCVNGTLSRPPVWFSIPDNAAYIQNGYANDYMVFMELRPRGEGKSRPLAIGLNAPAEPKAVWVDGERVTPVAKGNRWQIPASDGSFVAVLFQEPSGTNALNASLALNRLVETATKRDLFDPAFWAGDLTGARRNRVEFGFPKEIETYLPLKASAGSGDGMLRLAIKVKPDNSGGSCRINGKLTNMGPDGLSVPLKASELILVSLSAPAGAIFQMEWIPASAK